jgi:hypothetical protein
MFYEQVLGTSLHESSRPVAAREQEGGLSGGGSWWIATVFLIVATLSIQVSWHRKREREIVCDVFYTHYEEKGVETLRHVTPGRENITRRYERIKKRKNKEMGRESHT